MGTGCLAGWGRGSPRAHVQTSWQEAQRGKKIRTYPRQYHQDRSVVSYSHTQLDSPFHVLKCPHPSSRTPSPAGSLHRTPSPLCHHEGQDTEGSSGPNAQTSQNQLRMRKEEFSSKVVWFLCFQRRVGTGGTWQKKSPSPPTMPTPAPPRPGTPSQHT